MKFKISQKWLIKNKPSDEQWFFNQHNDIVFIYHFKTKAYINLNMNTKDAWDLNIKAKADKFNIVECFKWYGIPYTEVEK